MKKINHIWIFSDSIKGHELQSQALASELSDNIEVFHCTIRQPWLSFAPRILPRFGRNIIWEKSKPDTTNKPHVIITCGRRMAAVGKYYARLLKTKHIQILNPGDNPKKYSILICPEHDRISGKNIINTKGSLHSISIESLKELKCSKELKNSVVVLIGNPAKRFFNDIDNLAEQLCKTYPTLGLIICGSRRTPKRYHIEIQQAFKYAQQIWLSDKDGDNPYLKALASSEVIIVTADSINMISEACATDKQVVVVGKKHVSPKHKLFIDSISKRLSSLGEKTDKYKPMEVLKEVVEQVLEKI